MVRQLPPSRTDLALADPAPSRADASRQQILAVAARFFRERGYAGTSLRDIAAEVGMKAGSLYYHFVSKEELAGEVLRIGIERVHRAVLDRLVSLGSEATARARIEAAINAHLDTLHFESDYVSAHIRCFPYVPPAVREGLRRVRRDYEAVWRRLIEEAAQAGTLADQVEPGAVRLAILGALNWSLEWFDPARDRRGAFATALARSFIKEAAGPRAARRRMRRPAPQ